LAENGALCKKCAHKNPNKKKLKIMVIYINYLALGLAISEYIKCSRGGRKR
jgi:hypothetical protein